MNLMFENNPLLNGDFSKLEIDSNVDLKTTSKEEVEISQGELEVSQEKEEITTEEVTFEIPDDGKFPQEVFDLAPDVLKPLLETFTGREKDIVLLSSLTHLSAIFPKVFGYYRDELFFPNLYLFVIGQAATGKSKLSIGEKIIQKVKEEILTRNSNFFIPANNSSSKLQESLSNSFSDGSYIHDNEADTLSFVLKREWGNYSEILRKAFQHERISISRKSYPEIICDTPRLTVAISGTGEQLKPLIQSRENGLFSRIMFYTYSERSKWNDGSYVGNRRQEINNLNEYIFNVYEVVNSLEREFYLNEEQLADFNNFFEGYFNAVQDIDENLVDIVLRQAIMMFRLMMIYTVLEKIEEFSDEMDQFECSDRAIDFMKAILPYLLRNSIDTAGLYDKSVDLKDSESEILKLLPQNFKRGEAVKIVVEKLSVSESTVDKALRSLLRQGMLRKSGSRYSVLN
ncbi:YfjI family protein [Empedobacter falsenii]